MQKLTDQDIEKELRMITIWPTTADYVFMKNLYDGRTGVILFKLDRDNKPITLDPYPEDSLGFAKIEPVTGPSLRALIEGGWVVD